MEFVEKKGNKENGSITEWHSKNYIVAILNYLFGQKRIQIWHDIDSSFPGVMMPNF